MKRLRLIIFSALIFSSCSSQSFISISKRIENKCERNKSWRGTTFNDIRISLYKKGQLGFMPTKIDTFYLLEAYDVESGSYIGKIWNAQNGLDFKFRNSRFTFDQTNYFTHYTIQLVQQWDTLSIRKEEKENGKLLPERIFKAIRVTKINNKVKISCILFREFFDLERDRNNGS